MKNNRIKKWFYLSGLGISLLVLPLFSDISAHDYLTGYKMTVIKKIHEDKSLSVRYELNMDPDAKETIEHKRNIFLRNHYQLIEEKKDHAYYLIAIKSFPPASGEKPFGDELAEFRITSRHDTFYFREHFFNFLLRDEVDSSSIRKDTAMVKVLMADTEYEFKTIMPGLITYAGIGESARDTALWQYDIESLFHRRTLSMTTFSCIHRDEDITYIIYLIAALLLAIAGLMIYRNRVVSHA